MTRYLRLYRVMIKFSLLMVFAYRTSFFIELAVEIAYSLWVIVFFQIIYANVTQIAGWSYAEVVFLMGMGIAITEFLVGMFFVWGIRILPERIAQGEIDLYLVKPMHSLFSLTMGRPYLTSIISIIPGLFLIWYARTLLHVTVTWTQALAGVVVMLCGMVLCYCLWVLGSSLTFIWDRATNLPRLMAEITWYGSNPHSVYEGGFKWLFRFVFPVIFYASVPTMIWLGEVNWIFVGLALVLALGFGLFTLNVWNRLMRRYSSASS